MAESIERTGFLASAAARQRRAQLRAQLCGMVGRRRRWRRAARGAVFAGLVAVVACWWSRAGCRDDGAGAAAVVAAPPPCARRDPFACVVVHDDPTVVARLRMVAAPSAVSIDDRGLAAALVDCGRAIAPVRVDGQLLLPGLVVDDWQ